MSQDKEDVYNYDDAIKDDELVIHVLPGGDTRLGFFPVSYSDFVIDYIYGKKDKERLAKTGCRRIYCG